MWNNRIRNFGVDKSILNIQFRKMFDLEKLNSDFFNQSKFKPESSILNMYLRKSILEHLILKTQLWKLNKFNAENSISKIHVLKIPFWKLNFEKPITLNIQSNNSILKFEFWTSIVANSFGVSIWELSFVINFERSVTNLLSVSNFQVWKKQSWQMN